MKKQLIHFLKLIARLGLIVMNDGFLCMATKKGTVVFESFNGKDVNDNPYAIYRQLVANNPELKEKLYFSVKPREYKRLHKEHPEIKLVKRFTPAWVPVIARAQFWVMNSRMPAWWHKNKNTTYIQTWHGTPLKRLGADIENVEIPGKTTEQYHQEFIKEAQRWQYLIAPNQYSKDIFTRAFQFNNHFLDIGYPRNDVLYTDNNAFKIKHLKQTLLGHNFRQVILYAPTWRDDDYIQPGQYHFTLPFDLKKFFDMVGDDVALIIRPHYLVADQVDVTGFEDRVFVRTAEDINQLYLISDLLITDYSSVMFDYANLKRPMLFYPYDLKHYQKELRGFYFPYDEQHLPGPVVTNPADFYQQLAIFKEAGTFPAFKSQLQQFNQQFCQWENGYASNEVAKLIKKLITERKMTK